MVVAAGGRGVSASVSVDDEEVNQILLALVRVGETHGVKFPR